METVSMPHRRLTTFVEDCRELFWKLMFGSINYFQFEQEMERLYLEEINSQQKLKLVFPKEKEIKL